MMWGEDLRIPVGRWIPILNPPWSCISRGTWTRIFLPAPGVPLIRVVGALRLSETMHAPRLYDTELGSQPSPDLFAFPETLYGGVMLVPPYVVTETAVFLCSLPSDRAALFLPTADKAID